jgi:signal transduction histidine kinase
MATEIKDGGWDLLTDITEKISRGDLKAVDDLVALPGKSGIASDVARLAEAVGMIMVRMEAHEFHLDLASEAEQRLKDLNELKNRHLGIAAHDLRNPLSSIRGMSQMLVDTELDQETQRRFLDSIYRVSNQMLTLINDLLDIAVIESGKFELKLEEGVLSELATERAELAARVAERKDIAIETAIEETTSLPFDRDRMAQVLDNLLSNAIKFSSEGTVVRVSCRDLDGRVEVAVTDQGPGIPPKDLDNLFGVFQKASASPTSGEKSTGLGLSIVKNIVEAHNGNIAVESEVGVGSTFTVTIPLKHGKDELGQDDSA